MLVKISSSFNHFIDTNVLFLHANNDSGQWAGDIAKILEEATGSAPKRALWISSVIFAELRESQFVPGAFSSVVELSKYIRSIATVVTPDPGIMMRAARLRDITWQRPVRMRGKSEKPKRMTLGDAIHIASALEVKESYKIEDLEFLTLDDKSSASSETDHGTKSLPLLSLENYTADISGNPDVFATVALSRVRPILSQMPIDFSATTAPSATGAPLEA